MDKTTQTKKGGGLDDAEAKQTLREKIEEGLKETEIKGKKINKYALYDESLESRETNLASKRHIDSGICLIIDGEYYNISGGKLFDKVYSWDAQLFDGSIKQKTAHNSIKGSRGHGFKKERIKIEREAVEKHEIIVVEYISKTGGGIDSEEYDKFEIEKAEKLITSD